MLTEAETSGGLLFSIARDRAAGVMEAFAAAGETCAEIGEVIADSVIRITP
jgi:selenophosphate synthase